MKTKKVVLWLCLAVGASSLALYGCDTDLNTDKKKKEETTEPPPSDGGNPPSGGKGPADPSSLFEENVHAACDLLVKCEQVDSKEECLEKLPETPKYIQEKEELEEQTKKCKAEKGQLKNDPKTNCVGLKSAKCSEEPEECSYVPVCVPVEDEDDDVDGGDADHLVAMCQASMDAFCGWQDRCDDELSSKAECIQWIEATPEYFGRCIDHKKTMAETEKACKAKKGQMENYQFLSCVLLQQVSCQGEGVEEFVDGCMFMPVCVVDGNPIDV